MSTKIFITGRPGSGKTKLGMQRYEEMMRQGLHVVLCDETECDVRTNRPKVPHTQADVQILCAVTTGNLTETTRNEP